MVGQSDFTADEELSGEETETDEEIEL